MARTPQQDTPDEQPGDEHRAGDADRGDRQQQGSPGENCLAGCFGGCLGPEPAPCSPARPTLADQESRDVIVIGQQFSLPFVKLQFAGAQVEQAEPFDGRRIPVPPRCRGSLRPAFAAGRTWGTTSPCSGDSAKPSRLRLMWPIEDSNRSRIGSIKAAFGHGGGAGKQLYGNGAVFLQFRQVNGDGPARLPTSAL